MAALTKIKHFAALKDFPKYLNTTQWNRIALVFLVALLGIGLGVGFSVASTKANNDAEADYSRRLNLFTTWQTSLTERFTRAGAVSSAFAAFALSSATVPANLSAPSVDRIKPLNPVAFERLAIDFYNELPGLFSLQLQSGGVVAQAYPVGSIAVGLDIMNLDVYKPVYKQLIEEKKSVISGPTQIQSVSGLGISVRYPVFLSANKSRESFWGIGNVLMKVVAFLNATGIDVLPQQHNLDYLMWYTETDVNTSKIVTRYISSSYPANNEKILAEGMQMKLPLAEHGKACYLNLYPRDGPVSDQISGDIVTTIIVVVLIATAISVFALYFALFAHFAFRHRNAPTASPGSMVFISAITLRGAQPIFERAPLEAVRMFNEFVWIVRQQAVIHGCYVVCEIGDRCVYVVANDPVKVLALTKYVVANVTILGNVRGNIDTAANQLISVANNKTLNSSAQLSHSTFTATTATHMGAKTSTSCANTAATSPSNTSVSEISAIISSIYCRPSAACHAAIIPSTYDPVRDVYFYGSVVALSQLAAAVDQTVAGEVAWTPIFNKEALARMQSNNTTAKNNVISRSTNHYNTRKNSTSKVSISPVPKSITRRNSYNSESQDPTERTEEARSEPSVSYDASPGAISTMTAAVEVSRTVEERGRVALYIACYWRDETNYEDDERENQARNKMKDMDLEGVEDPSTAMAVLNDAYLQKMTVIASEERHRKSRNKRSGRGGLFGGRHGHGGKRDGDPNSGDHSDSSTATKKQELTSVTRNSTILHIALGCSPSDMRPVVEVIRRIVTEERGTVVSAHETTVVATFNLLTPGGYHETRAADTVMRLRDALGNASVCTAGDKLLDAGNYDSSGSSLNVPFVCSLHRGKITALVGENGMVMCTGEAVLAGFNLLQRAKEMYVEMFINSYNGVNNKSNKLNNTNVEATFSWVVAFQNQLQLKKQQETSGINSVTLFTDATHSGPTTPRNGVVGSGGVAGTSDGMLQVNGLCLLYCYEDICTSYDCEAVELAPLPNAAACGLAALLVSPSKSINAFISPFHGSTSPPHSSTMNLNLKFSATPSSRIVFRLVDFKPSASKKGNNNFNDEWMYRVKDEEDQCAYTAINAVFARLATGDQAEAERLWSSFNNNVANHQSPDQQPLSASKLDKHMCAAQASELSRSALGKIFAESQKLSKFDQSVVVPHKR